jgi:hypothetical protein
MLGLLLQIITQIYSDNMEENLKNSLRVIWNTNGLLVGWPVFGRTIRGTASLRSPCQGGGGGDQLQTSNR